MAKVKFSLDEVALAFAYVQVNCNPDNLDDPETRAAMRVLIAKLEHAEHINAKTVISKL